MAENDQIVESADKQMDYKNTGAVKNKWIADIDLSIISPDLSKVVLPLTEFTIPEVSVSTAKTYYRGVEFEIPTGVFKPTAREITFGYLIDQDWVNYISLYQWINLYCPVEQVTPDELIARQDNYVETTYPILPINVYLLGAYKTPLVRIKYENCYIKQFGDISLAYQDDPDIIKQEFTIRCTDFSIFKINQNATTP